MAAGHYFVRRESLGRGIEQVWIPRFAELSALWKFTVPALIVGMAFMPATWAANAMLVRQENGYAEMGVFNAATQWRNAYQFIPSIIYTAAFPVLSQLLANKDQASFKKLALAQLGSSVGIVALLFVGAIPLAPMLMASFGSQFAGHTRVFVLTTVNAVPFTFSSVAGALMLAANKPWWAAAGALLWAAVLLAAAGPAVTFGALGLAASHLLAYMAMAGWCAYFLSRLGVFARRG
jgi:O-antigen/teichoic acid export membrane protein